MPKLIDIKSLLIMSFITIYGLFFSVGFAAAEGCKNKNYVILSLDSYYKYVIQYPEEKGITNAAGSEDFDAIVDILAKDSPECLVAAFPELSEDTKQSILRRVKADDSRECKPNYKPDHEDRDWCHPTLRETKEDCYDEKGKPFYWCKVYPSILKKLKLVNFSSGGVN